jgi:hypothetical protein
MKYKIFVEGYTVTKDLWETINCCSVTKACIAMYIVQSTSNLLRLVTAHFPIG